MSEKFTVTSSENEREEAEAYFAFLVDKTISTEEVIKRYNETSDKYEKMYETIVFNGATETAATLAQLFPTDREHVNILDVAAGTGLCAVEYFKHGFRQMDALDASKEMLEEAEKKGLYNRIIQAVLGERTLNIQDDTYDVVTVCNFCIEIMRKLPMKSFEELIRVVKPGGYIVNTNYYTTFQEGYERTEEFRRKVRALECEGKWKKIEVRHFPAYQYGRDGGVSVHQVC